MANRDSFGLKHNVSTHPEQRYIDRIQAAFEAQDRRQLIYSGQLDQRNLYHLTRLVAASPNCLDTHVRRIFLSLQCRDRCATAGALLDLFLVLKGRGGALFQRLLDLASRLLGARIRGLFAHAFERNDATELMRLPLTWSVLANGRAGTLYRVWA